MIFAGKHNVRMIIARTWLHALWQRPTCAMAAWPRPKSIN